MLERGAGDPQTFAGLAAVGQLTTRLQRHADGLLVLSGGSPTRSGEVTLPIGDLLRAAIAEVDDGSRVTVVGDSADAVAAEPAARRGRAVELDFLDLIEGRQGNRLIDRGAG